MAGPVPAETVPIDASLIRANVSMDAPVARHLDAVGDRNDAAWEARMSGRFKARLDAIKDTLGVPPDRITADTIHGVGRV